MDNFSDILGNCISADSRIGGREENQDDYGIIETPLGALTVVCDGMGGGPAGKTASSMARETIMSFVCSAEPSADPGQVLRQAAVAANAALIAAQSANPDLMGMGSTCVCLLVKGSRAYIVHVGDSRCYQLRNGNVVFRTADHSYVAELVRHGTITEEQARTSGYSNVITRALGAKQLVDPETDVVKIMPGDRFALMSDGIWGALSQDPLVRMLCNNPDVASTVDTVCTQVDTLGQDNGGSHDNLTLALVEIMEVQSDNNDAAAEEYTIEEVPNDSEDAPAQSKAPRTEGAATWPPSVTAPQAPQKQAQTTAPRPKVTAENPTKPKPASASQPKRTADSAPITQVDRPGQTSRTAARIAAARAANRVSNAKTQQTKASIAPVTQSSRPATAPVRQSHPTIPGVPTGLPLKKRRDRKRHKLLILLLYLLFGFAAGIICYLIFSKSYDDRAASVSSTVINMEDAPGDVSQIANAGSVDNASAKAEAAIENATIGFADVKSSAKSTLNELWKYEHKGFKKNNDNDIKACQNERKVIHNRLKTQLGQLVSQATSASKKQAESLQKDISNDSGLFNGIDRNRGLTTSDTEKKIKNYLSRLENIK